VDLCWRKQRNECLLFILPAAHQEYSFLSRSSLLFWSRFSGIMSTSEKHCSQHCSVIFFFTGLCWKGSPTPVCTNLYQQIIIRVWLFTFYKVIKGVPLYFVLDWSQSQKLANILLNLLTGSMSPYKLLKMESTKCWETMSTLDSLLSLRDMLLLTVILFSGSCLSQILHLL